MSYIFYHKKLMKNALHAKLKNLIYFSNIDSIISLMSYFIFILFDKFWVI
jgi:hypothetical protein